MAVNVLNAAVEQRAQGRTRTPRYIVPTFRSLRHGIPAATNDDRNRDDAIVSRSDAERALYEAWGWA
jgi:hypothetical protein